MGRDAERSVASWSAGAEAFGQGRADRARRDAELGERVGGEFVGLCEQPQDEVLGADVLVSVLAGCFGRRSERGGGGAGKPGRQLARWWCGEGDVVLLGGLLGDAEGATDLGPAAVGRAGSVDVMVQQLVGAGAQRTGKLVRG